MRLAFCGFIHNCSSTHSADWDVMINTVCLCVWNRKWCQISRRVTLCSARPQPLGSLSLWTLQRRLCQRLMSQLCCRGNLDRRWGGRGWGRGGGAGWCSSSTGTAQGWGVSPAISESEKINKILSFLHLSFRLYLTDSIKKNQKKTNRFQLEVWGWVIVIQSGAWRLLLLHNYTAQLFFVTKSCFKLKVPYSPNWKISIFNSKLQWRSQKKHHGCPENSTISHLKYLLDLPRVCLRGVEPAPGWGRGQDARLLKKLTAVLNGWDKFGF